jgi:hypothetical protein
MHHYQITKVAVEQSEQLRLQYTTTIGEYNAERLIFINESATDRQTTYRNVAWALKGQRAMRKSVFIRGTRYVLHNALISSSNCCRYSILPALSLDGIIYCDIVNRSFNMEWFKAFIQGLIISNATNPWPGQNSVIIMDNCVIHKNAKILHCPSSIS